MRIAECGIRNPKFEAPAFAEAASRRQAKLETRMSNPKLKILNSKQTRMTKIRNLMFGSLVKSRHSRFFVIPAKAGIQFFQIFINSLDTGFHRCDDFLRIYYVLVI
jgi:hypothetical protein